MRIIIPTRGRTREQLTLQTLKPPLTKITTLVCPEKEIGALRSLRDDIEVVAQPDSSWMIAQKREWIIKHWHDLGIEKIIMLDDDLRFATRRAEGDWRLKEISGQELADQFQLLWDKLNPECPHVGFGQRQGNNRLEETGWKSPGKIVYTLGYYLPIVVKECEFNRVRTREDMDIALQLLRKGYPNAVWNTTVVDQREFGAKGGTSDERTVESSNEDCYKLAELHSGYVSVSDRGYKASVPRKEVIVQWQKALDYGRRNRQD